MIEGRVVPFQIRAQSLRHWEDFTPAGGLSGIAFMPEQTTTPSRRKGSWRQSDITRAIGAAEQAGLGTYRVEIAPDGTITIVVGESPEAPGG
jgi:hypothetical protein